MTKVVNLGNGEVQVARPKRRLFTADYKLKILAEANACKQCTSKHRSLR